MKNIVVLDGYVVNPGDLSWDSFSSLGTTHVYDRTSQDEIINRAADANVILTNKCQLTKDILVQLPILEYIGLIATGYNNIDVKAATERGITVCNARGYGALSVAQHVFALMLELTNQVGQHNYAVKKNRWATSLDWSFWDKPIIELFGKTLGIYGFGSIGNQVASIALAFGMHVIATRKNKDKGSPDGVKLVDEAQLFKESDVITLHATMTDENKNIMNSQVFDLMKPSAFLINTGRGGLVNESDLRRALTSGQIAGAALDVLDKEPPNLDHPLTTLDNCIITPHHAWASKNSRERLLSIVFENLNNYLNGHPQNICL